MALFEFGNPGQRRWRSIVSANCRIRDLRTNLRSDPQVGSQKASPLVGIGEEIPADELNSPQDESPRSSEGGPDASIYRIGE